jgi:hypothetical protein
LIRKRPPRSRASRLLAGLAALAALGPPRAEAQDAAKLLGRRTALLIEQITRFVEWPAAALPQDGRFVLCLQGASETAHELSNVAAIHRFKRRTTDVRRLQPGDDPGGCHVLYVAGSEAQHLPPLLAAVSGKAILTVSDTAGFVAKGVHFNFFPVTRSKPKPGVYPHFEWSVQAVRRTTLLRFDPGLLSQGNQVDVPTPANTRGPGQ